MFKRFRKTNPDVELRNDTEYWDVVAPARFDRIVETQTHFVAFNEANVIVARIPKPEPCVGTTHDWDAGIDIECPEHRGVYCPGGRSPLN